MVEGQENQAAANPPLTSQHTTPTLDIAVRKSVLGNSGVSFSGCQNITVSGVARNNEYQVTLRGAIWGH